LGIHPWNVSALKENELQQTLQLISTHKQNQHVVAIGEIALDRRYGKMCDKHLMVFKEMLSIAEKLQFPIIVHSCCAAKQMIEMLPSYNINKVLMHWFSHLISALSKAVENGYLITEGPPLVYSKDLREVVRRIPLTNFLTETDGPVIYKKPPFNGKMSMPSFL